MFSFELRIEREKILYQLA